MALLRHLGSDTITPLPARLLVGRAASCALCLPDRMVSGEHASVVWMADHWIVRDLGSSNGTFVDGRRLEPGESARVESGSRIAFGQPDDCWQLDDAGAPCAVARDIDTGDWLTAEHGILALPPDAPEAVVYADARGRWMLEHGDDARPIDHEAVVSTASGAWRVLLPATIEGTTIADSGPSIDTIGLRFEVSRDEEHVLVTVLHRGKETELERREHGYTLLTLARQRVDESGDARPEQGWVDRDELLKMLGVDANGLNVAIYRARGQLSRAGIEGAAGVVEVRRGQRRLGIEADRLHIVRL